MSGDRIVRRYVDVGDADPDENVLDGHRRFPEIRVTFNENVMGVSLWVQVRYHGPEFELPLTAQEAAVLAKQLGRPKGTTKVISGVRWPRLTLRHDGRDVALAFRGSSNSTTLEVDLTPSNARALAEHIDRAVSGHRMLVEIAEIPTDQPEEN